MLLEDQLDDKNDNGREEHEDGYPVDPMHILHPLRMRRIGIPLFNVEILGNLSPHSHKK
jgi:hypothetical protein